MRKLCILLVSLSLVACVTKVDIKREDPAPILEQKEKQCSLFAQTVEVGQEAKNAGMPLFIFQRNYKRVEEDPRIPPIAKEIALAGLKRGYAGPQGADVEILVIKAFDDCMDSST